VNKSPAHSIIGLDVGGSKVAGGIVTFPGGNVFAKKIIPTRAERGGEAVLGDSLELAAALRRQAEDADLTVEAMGVCVCELVDLHGNVTSDQSIAWRGLDLRARFSKLVPTVIAGDTRAAALAEGRFGAGQNLNVYVYVTIGTGISYALVQGGRPYTGAHGNAMLIGNTPLRTARGTGSENADSWLEHIASGPALVSRYNRASAREVTRAEQVVAAAQAGDQTAADILRTGGDAMGIGIALLVNLLDPEAVLIGGGLGLAEGLYWKHMIDAARQSIWSDTSRDIPMLKGALGTDAPIIGAAAVALEQLGDNR